MVDFCVACLLAHPLPIVGLLAVCAVGLGLLPRVHEMVLRGHPRC